MLLSLNFSYDAARAGAALAYDGSGKSAQSIGRPFLATYSLEYSTLWEITNDVTSPGRVSISTVSQRK